MEKGYPPQESAPPYPGPPINYGGVPPQPGMYPQPGFIPAAPPPAGYHGGLCLRSPLKLKDTDTFYTSEKPLQGLAM